MHKDVFYSSFFLHFVNSYKLSLVEVKFASHYRIRFIERMDACAFVQQLLWWRPAIKTKSIFPMRVWWALGVSSKTRFSWLNTGLWYYSGNYKGVHRSVVLFLLFYFFFLFSAPHLKHELIHQDSGRVERSKRRYCVLQSNLNRWKIIDLMRSCVLKQSKAAIIR